MRALKKTTRHVCIVYLSTVEYQFYIHFQYKYQLGGFVHWVRLLGFALALDPMGDFCPPGYLSLCVDNPSPQSY